jgi:hypothetical protein
MTRRANTPRLLGWQQIATKEALEFAAMDLRAAMDAEARKRMQRAAGDEGVTLDPAGPVRHESDLVWVENWDGEGYGQHVSVEIARMAGVTDEPDAVLMRWTWREVDA